MADYRYVIFDLDGTLVDSLPGIEYSAASAIAAVLPDAVPRGLRNYIGPPIRRIFERMFDGLDASTLDRLEREFRLSYDSDGWRRTIAYANAASTLSQLARWNVPSFVATNKPLAAALKILDALGLARHLKAVVAPDAQCPGFASKAAMVGWLMTSRKLPGETGLLVGDSADDRAAAEAHGLRFAAARYGYGDAGSSAGAAPMMIPEGDSVSEDLDFEELVLEDLVLEDIGDLIKLFPGAAGGQ